MSFKLTRDTLHAGTNETASFNTEYVDLSYLNQGSFQVSIVTGGGVSWTVAVQGSNDSTTWVDTANPTAFTGTTNLMFSIADLTSIYYRVAFTRTSGTLTSATVVCAAKG